jgi:hypothetical protein
MYKMRVCVSMCAIERSYNVCIYIKKWYGEVRVKMNDKY